MPLRFGRSVCPFDDSGRTECCRDLDPDGDLACFEVWVKELDKSVVGADSVTFVPQEVWVVARPRCPRLPSKFGSPLSPEDLAELDERKAEEEKYAEWEEAHMSEWLREKHEKLHKGKRRR